MPTSLLTNVVFPVSVELAIVDRFKKPGVVFEPPLQLLLPIAELLVVAVVSCTILCDILRLRYGTETSFSLEFCEIVVFLDLEKFIAFCLRSCMRVADLARRIKLKCFIGGGSSAYVIDRAFLVK